MAGFPGNWKGGRYEGPGAYAVAATLGLPRRAVDVDPNIGGGYGNLDSPARMDQDRREFTEAKTAGEAHTMRQMGRIAGLEEHKGLSVRPRGEAAQLTYEGTTYTYKGGQLRGPNGRRTDLGDLANRIYGYDKGTRGEQRLIDMIEKRLSGGGRDRAKREAERFGRRKREAA